MYKLNQTITTVIRKGFAGEILQILKADYSNIVLPAHLGSTGLFSSHAWEFSVFIPTIESVFISGLKVSPIHITQNDIFDIKDVEVIITPLPHDRKSPQLAHTSSWEFLNPKQWGDCGTKGEASPAPTPASALLFTRFCPDHRDTATNKQMR